MHRDDAKSARLLRILIALWLVAIVWAIFPYTREPTGAIKELILRVGAAGLFLMYVVVGWKARSDRATPDAQERVPPGGVVVFAAWYLVAVVWAGNVGAAFYVASGFVALAGVYVVARWAYRTADQVWVMVALVAGAVVVSSAYGFAQFFGWDPMPWDTGIAEAYGALRQGPSTFGNANYASHALVLAVVLTAGWACARRSWAAAVPLIVFALHFGLTRTRGSLVALGVAGLFVGVAWVVGRRNAQEGTYGHGPARTNTDRSAVVSLAVVGLVGLVVVLGVGVVSYLRTASPLPYDPTAAIRVQTLAGATAMVRERAVGGWGPGGYALANPMYWTDDEQRRYAETGAYNENVHSDLVEVGVDTGLVGAALFLAVIAFALVSASRLVASEGRSERVLGYCGAAFVVAFFVDGWFGFPLHTPVASALFFVLIGAIGGIGTPAQPSAAPWPLRLGMVAGGVLLTCGAALGVTDFLGELYAQQGRAARATGNVRAADEAYATAARFAPYDWRASYERAAIAMRTGRALESATLYERAVSLNPGNVYARLGAARARLQAANVGRFEDELTAAVRHAEVALAMNPYVAEAHDVLGRAMALEAQWAENEVELWQRAEVRLARAVELQTAEQASTWRVIAQAREAQGDTVGAFAALAAALQAAPDETQTWSRLEALSAETGAYRALAQAVEWRLGVLRAAGHFTGNETAALYVRLAAAREHQGAAQTEVLAVYRDAIAAERGRPETWDAFLDWAIQANAIESFTEQLSAVAEGYAAREASMPFALQPAGLAAIEDDLNVAVDALESALAREWPQRALPRVKIGLRVSGGYIAALAVARDGGARALIVAGRALNVGDDAAGALEAFRKAEERLAGAERVDALLGQAVALTLMERGADAIAALERAAALDMRRLDVRLALAGAYVEAERWAAARLEYEAILGQLGAGDPLRGTVEEQLGRIP